MRDTAARVLEALSKSGILLQQDKRLPNVVSIVTGEALSTSWWSHPKAQLIFVVLTELSEHPDVLFTKLLNRKVTLLHRALWPAFLAVAESGESWQWTGLSDAAKTLLNDVNQSQAPLLRTGAEVKELEKKLLAHAEDVHTESGRHKTALESWTLWRKRVQIEPLISPAAGREFLEKAASALSIPTSAFPWAQ